MLFIITLFFAPSRSGGRWTAPSAVWPVAGCVLLLVLGMEKLLGREAMGGGDIKLLFLTGLFWAGSGTFCVWWRPASSASCGDSCKKKRDGGEAIPWGPSIALGAWLTALCGQQIIDWYLGLL